MYLNMFGKILRNYSVITISVCLLVACPSCTEHTTNRQDVTAQQICLLQETISTLGEPYSFAIADDRRFVVTDFTNVFLYSAKGEQIRQIGNAGRAPFEYLNPSCVKIYKDTIYVWSANSLKFISYTMEGTPVGEYPYESAIRNFLPTDEHICIYTSGLRTDSVIDIYDKASHEIIQSLSPTSDEHKLLSHLWADAPLYSLGTDIYYCPKDRLDVYDCNESGRSQKTVAQIKSDSFKVDKVSGYDAIVTDRKRRNTYLNENSQTLTLFRQDGQFYLLTLEGDARLSEDAYDTSNRYFSLYSVSEQELVAQYNYDSIGNPALFSSNADGLYFIKISDDEQHPYSLHKLIL